VSAVNNNEPSPRFVICSEIKSNLVIYQRPGSQFVVKMKTINRADIKPGSHVKVVQKQDQRSGKLTEGVVKDILTKSASHPHGIKVRLESGIVGRVKELIPKNTN